ncbi:MAG TPA: hypothetical protein VGO56_13970 [Pyrinomonadaceae bacterium]|jgi:hypothetical protein|nr:hypothetical protein [Pyrinomonadaceae bacterium]
MNKDVFDFNYYYRVKSLASSIPSSYGHEKEVTDKYVHAVGFNDPKDHHEAMHGNTCNPICGLIPIVTIQSKGG